ncbi:eukaryotic translation initiation factor eIF1-like [Tubulanus polymorphus]|uniref:eukaryotic translation initiation factor eIF1-like n=1 Tax=Tubulanus polymorphus TaxID=672921 RepID=UPI003DA67828
MSGRHIQNLKEFDPFADVQGGSTLTDEGIVHVRIQQRNGRKTLTTVQGLHEKFDKKLIAKYCKKHFACNGTVVEHPEYGEVIQLQGDQRDAFVEFLKSTGMAKPEAIKVHGF